MVVKSTKKKVANKKKAVKTPKVIDLESLTEEKFQEAMDVIGAKTTKVLVVAQDKINALILKYGLRASLTVDYSKIEAVD